MHTPSKYQLQLLERYRPKLEQAKLELEKLHAYNDTLPILGFLHLIKPEEVEQMQMDYWWMLERWEGKEKEFHHEGWLPILSSELGMFMDLDTEDFPIIDTIFKFTGDHGYYSDIYFSSPDEIIELIESGQRLKHYREHFEIRLMFKQFEDNPDALRCPDDEF